MAKLAIEKYNKANDNRDDWQLSHEIRTIQKFQNRLGKNKINVRLFEKVQRHIQFAYSGRIDDADRHIMRRLQSPHGDIVS